MYIEFNSFRYDTVSIILKQKYEISKHLRKNAFVTLKQTNKQLLFMKFKYFFIIYMLLKLFLKYPVFNLKNKIILRYIN